MIDTNRRSRQPGRGRGGGRGVASTRNRYDLRSGTTSPANGRKTADGNRTTTISDNDEKIWNLVTTKNTNTIQEVKIKQEMIDTAASVNQYGILDSEDTDVNENTSNTRTTVDLTTDVSSHKQSDDNTSNTTKMMLEALDEVTQTPQRKNKRSINTVQDDDKFTKPVNAEFGEENDTMESEETEVNDVNVNDMEEDNDSTTIPEELTQNNSTTQDMEILEEDTVTKTSSLKQKLITSHFVTALSLKKNGFTLTADIPAETGVPVSEENPKEAMKGRGEIMTEDVVKKETPSTFEFNVNKATKVFNIRDATMKLISVMFKADNCLRIKSKIDNTVWGPDDEVPQGSEFHDHFATKEINPQYGPKKAISHITLITSEEISRLKWRPSVKEYIMRNNIWIKEDKYQTRITSTPGYFTNLHPRMTWKPSLKNEIEIGIKKVKVDDDNVIVQEWKTKNATVTNISQTNTTPEFHLQTQTRKWGQIQTEVIGIISAKEDAQYLKYLLSQASKEGFIKTGVYIPIGIHLVEGPGILTDILSAHNQHLEQLDSFEVMEVTKKKMLERDEEAQGMSLRDKLLECQDIMAVEQTPVTESRGIWTIITTKSQITMAKEQTETLIPGKIKDMQPNYSANPTKRPRINRVSNIVGSYAEVLKRRIGIQKSSYKTVTTDNNSSPQSHIPNTPNKPTQRRMITPISKEGTQKHPIEHNAETLEERLRQVEQNIEEKIKNLPTRDSISTLIQESIENNETTMTEDKIRTLIVQHSKNSIGESTMTEESISSIIEKKLNTFESQQNNKLKEITETIFTRMNTTMNQIDKKISDLANVLCKNQLQQSQMPGQMYSFPFTPQPHITQPPGSPQQVQGYDPYGMFSQHSGKSFLNASDSPRKTAAGDQ